MPDIEITSRTLNDHVIMEIAGTADNIKVVNEIQTAVETAISSGTCNLAINLSKATYINSGLLGLFIHWYKMLKERDATFSIVDPDKYSRELLDLTGIAKVITIYESEDDLIKAIEQS